MGGTGAQGIQGLGAEPLCTKGCTRVITRNMGIIYIYICVYMHIYIYICMYILNILTEFGLFISHMYIYIYEY